MENKSVQFQNSASRVSGRITLALELAGLRVDILRLLPILKS